MSREGDDDSSRCVVMGILNVTPDSFSDGGLYENLGTAVSHGMNMVASGADYIDVGGESARPGAARVTTDEELRRVIPVVADLCRQGAAVSIDTTKARVAAAAIRAGAVIVNDVSGGLADPAMAPLIASTGVSWVLTHRRGTSEHMYQFAAYTDVVNEVCRELTHRVSDAIDAGVAAGQLIVDPGLGFAKQAEDDLALLAQLNAITGLGLPVLLGASRKRFLGSVLARHHGIAPQPASRDAATLAVTVFAAMNGVWGVRVHDVQANVDAARVVAAIRDCESVT